MVEGSVLFEGRASEKLRCIVVKWLHHALVGMKISPVNVEDEGRATA